jgi:hypothetical protein
MMQYYDGTDPYGGDGGDYGGGTGGDGGEPTGIIGGTDPNTRPTFTPGPNGWWAWIGGAWQWMTEPAPRTVSKTV